MASSTSKLEPIQKPEPEVHVTDPDHTTIEKKKHSRRVRPAPPSPHPEVPDDLFTSAIVFVAYALILATLPVSIWFCVQVIQEYERAVVFRLGRVRSGDAVGPGWFFLIPHVESYQRVDLRVVSFDVPPQELLTRDSVTVSVDAVVFYRVSRPVMAVANVADFALSTRFLAASTLRNTLGTRVLASILSDREAIAALMQESLDSATDPWGVKVDRVEIKDVRLPVQLQRAMAAEAEASREAKAKVIAAEGELTASRALKEASDVMSGSPGALQLRYLQTLNDISAERNSTIIFPMPIDLMGQLLPKK